MTKAARGRPRLSAARRRSGDEGKSQGLSSPRPAEAVQCCPMRRSPRRAQPPIVVPCRCGRHSAGGAGRRCRLLVAERGTAAGGVEPEAGETTGERDTHQGDPTIRSGDGRFAAATIQRLIVVHPVCRHGIDMRETLAESPSIGRDGATQKRRTLGAESSSDGRSGAERLSDSDEFSSSCDWVPTEGIDRCDRRWLRENSPAQRVTLRAASPVRRRRL